ncbi:hypothetical protein PYV61_25475, partial [Roseisolibacter sp. H3M3-2]
GGRDQVPPEERAGGAQARADTVVVLPAGFGPEAAAPGPDGSLWVSSMRTGRVVRLAAGGASHAPRELRAASVGEGRAALGIEAVPARGALWVAVSAMPQALGYGASRAARSALVELDLATGAERRRVEAPAGAHLGDVLVHPDGRVFAADGRAGAIWTLRPGESAFRPLVAAGTLRSAQGMTLADDGRSLVVADYARGLARVDLATGAAAPFAYAADVAPGALRGVDRLLRLPAAAGAEVERYVAVQNGTPPGRVLRVDVRRDTVVAVTPLLAGHPALLEPTTVAPLPGAHASGDVELLLVAASLWPNLGEDGATRGTPTPTAILRLRVPTR